MKILNFYVYFECNLNPNFSLFRTILFFYFIFLAFSSYEIIIHMKIGILFFMNNIIYFLFNLRLLKLKFKNPYERNNSSADRTMW